MFTVTVIIWGGIALASNRASFTKLCYAPTVKQPAQHLEFKPQGAGNPRASKPSLGAAGFIPVSQEASLRRAIHTECLATNRERRYTMAKTRPMVRRIVRGFVAATCIISFVALQTRPIRTMADVTFGVFASGLLVWAVILLVSAIRGDE